MESEIPLKYCLYARKSSESDEKQAMSIDSQIKEMLDMAKDKGLDIVATKKESHSAKESGTRPVFNEVLQEIRAGQYNALLTWAPDRLSRNAGDLGSLVDLMDQNKLVQIKTFSQTFSNNPNEKFLLMILCGQAKLENDNKSINVKRGIRTKCEMGWRPGVAPLGYMNRSFAGVKDIIPYPDRAPLITETFNRAAQGWSGRRLHEWLQAEGFTNRSGAKVSLSQVYLILNNTFYYGEFEYPIGSGQPYKGSHQPLITRELFEQVQQSRIVPPQSPWDAKVFPLKTLFRCGHCGASITAEEKFKPLQDGSFNRHVYYHCTKTSNPNCTAKNVSEAELTRKLVVYLDAHAEDVKINEALRQAVRQYSELATYVLQLRDLTSDKDPSLAEYTDYILSHGTIREKKQLVEGIQTKLAITNREIHLIQETS